MKNIHKSTIAFLAALIVIGAAVEPQRAQAADKAPNNPTERGAVKRGDAQSADDAAPPERGTVVFKHTAAEESVPKRFRLKEHSFEFESVFLKKSGPLRIYTVQFPSPVETDVLENNIVHAEYYRPKGDGPFPGVVVLHILGGEFALSKVVADSLARKGVAALFIEMPYYGHRRGRGRQSRKRMVAADPEGTIAGMTQAVLDIRRATAWLAARDEVDDERLGVSGISLGGIMSALSAAGEPRFRKVAIHLGGGNIAETIWNYKIWGAEAERRRWIAAGGTLESLKKTVSPIDPCTYGALLKDRKVLMVGAKHDEIIPPASVNALYESIGKKPELVWLDAGHFTAAAYLYGEIERMGHFFTADDYEPVKKVMSTSRDVAP